MRPSKFDFRIPMEEMPGGEHDPSWGSDDWKSIHSAMTCMA